MVKKIFQEILHDISQSSDKDFSVPAAASWSEFLDQHAADIAPFMESLPRKHFSKLFLNFPKKIKRSVFSELTDSLMAYSLSLLEDDDIAFVLKRSALNKLVCIFDYLSDASIFVRERRN